MEQLLKEDIEETATEDNVVDMDETVSTLMHYSLALEILSQVYLQAASNVTEEDKSHVILNSIKEDKDFINSYKNVMAKDVLVEYRMPPKKFRFYMKGADA